MLYLKADTAATLKIGPFLDDTDGKTAETGLTISQADVRLSKNGGDIAQKNESSSCTHDELGIYGCPIDATDTNTEGRLQLWVHESGALPVFHEYMVVNANVFDSLCAAAGTDYLQVDTLQLGGSTQSATDLKDFADAGYDPGTNKVEGVKLVDTTTTNTDMRGTDNAALASVCTETRLAELDAANMPSDIDAILTDTGTDGVLVQGDLSATMKASVNAEVDTALADINLDHLVKNAVDTNFATTVHLDSVIGQLADVGTTATFDRTTDALEAIRNQGDSAWITATSVTVSDKTGFSLSAAGNTAVIDEFETQSAADPTGFKVNVMEVNGTAQTANDNGADINAILADTGTDGVVAAASKTGYALTAADKDAIWDRQESTLSVSFETLMYRIFTLLSHKMNVTDADGSAALRNAGDSGNIATGSITDNDTTTTRDAWSWV